MVREKRCEKKHQSLDCSDMYKNYDLTPLMCRLKQPRFVIYFPSLSSVEWERRAV